jgi:hypothetical protein
MLQVSKYTRVHVVGSFLLFLLSGCCLEGADGFLVASRATRGHSTLHMTNGNKGGFWKTRWEAADEQEIRLDATLTACHTLARFLAYDITLPPKALPGMELTDIVMLVDTFTSALVLAIIWTVAGLLTRLFEDSQNWSRLLQTTAMAAPLWLLLELTLGWPAAAGDGPARFLVGSLGLLATMGLGRIVSSFLV